MEPDKPLTHRVKVTLDTSYDVAYWGLVFHATHDELITATSEVGFDALAVQTYFNKLRGLHGDEVPPGWEPDA